MPSHWGEAKTMYLDINLALSQVGDSETLHGMLVMLEETLSSDIPSITEHLMQGNVVEANRLLHPLKGFLPIFCIPGLCEDVTRVELLSKGGSPAEVAQAYAELRPALETLLQEVIQSLSSYQGV